MTVKWALLCVHDDHSFTFPDFCSLSMNLNHLLDDPKFSVGAVPLKKKPD